ncbi:MAG TPA: patatin-like phospholipase family protein [Gaiellaceae bacterium]|nr:patatin-like phospholipase family protein [Gaiellaceae bacterium]
MTAGTAQTPRFRYPVDPGRRCDVVMKGGITSGVVYPLGLCRLAERFLLQNIGGTSAGAIAAAAAAAAEYGRRHQSGEGYAALESLPHWLGETATGSEDSNLFNLFQPAPQARGLFALLVGAISHPKQTVAFEILMSGLANWRLRALLGALPGIALFALLFLALADRGGVTATIALIAGLLGALGLALVGAVGMLGFTLYRQAPQVLRENYFGICRGVSPDGASGGPEALTEWLHGLIRRASGAQGVLTFGDLWGAAEGPREIDLAMITTCLTLGRPYRLPFTRADGFFFDPAELDGLFPAAVVEHMTTHAGGDPVRGLLPLPEAAKLPVVFAARLSLSFPFLLSTVPLHQVTVGAHGAPEFVDCHFSDGGICSNFPITFFDSPLPRWPTFGINLAGPLVDDVEVWMPTANVEPTPGPVRPVTSVGSFAAAIRGAAQNWHDNSFVEMPGFRDRIAHIRFRDGEGGLNLNMPDELIRHLSDRGELAGRKLAARFSQGIDEPGGQPVELDWNNHRRIRQRVAFAALEDFAMELLVGYTGDETLTGTPRRYRAHTPMPEERTYPDLLAATYVPPVYADLDLEQRALAQAIAAIANPLAAAWAVVRGRDLEPCDSPAMSFGEPQPAMDVRIIPPL